MWEYLAFVVLAALITALFSPTSPLAGAIPLMLSYVLDYLDERRLNGRLAPGTTRQRDGRRIVSPDHPS